jgi:two-component system, NarL family, sensor kinase
LYWDVDRPHIHLIAKGLQMTEAVAAPRVNAGWFRGDSISARVAIDPDTSRAEFEYHLVWMRRLGLLAWGIVLYLEGGFRALDAQTVAYLGSVSYMELLHAHLYRSRNMTRTKRIAATGDSILAFTMCFMHGGMHSVFIPHFYLTIVAAAFRFRPQDSIAVLLLNLVLLFVLAGRNAVAGLPVNQMFFIIQYMLVAFSIGTLLANWAASNLKMAIDRSMALEQEYDRSQLLLRRLINVQEEERRALAEDLHDRMGESLFSIGHGIDTCIDSELPLPVRQKLSEVRRHLIGCTSDVRAFMNELRPNVLDELGLCEALVEYVAAMQPIVPFEIKTCFDPNLTKWRSKEDAMLFRLVQEAMLNVRKHAHASKLTVNLRRSRDGVSLEISDDGKGCDLGAVPSGHFGLLTMRERAEVSGGKMTIRSSPNAGTTILVKFKA